MMAIYTIALRVWCAAPSRWRCWGAGGTAAQRTKGAAAERELCHLPSERLAIATMALQAAKDAKHACAHVRQVLGSTALLTSGGGLQ